MNSYTSFLAELTEAVCQRVNSDVKYVTKQTTFFSNSSGQEIDLSLLSCEADVDFDKTSRSFKIKAALTFPNKKTLEFHDIIAKEAYGQAFANDNDYKKYYIIREISREVGNFILNETNHFVNNQGSQSFQKGDLVSSAGTWENIDLLWISKGIITSQDVDHPLGKVCDVYWFPSDVVQEKLQRDVPNFQLKHITKDP